MQILPCALEWRRRMRRQNSDHQITFQLGSPLAQAFAAAYVYPGGFGIDAPTDYNDFDLVEFPLERGGKQTVSQQAEKFFSSVHRDFFHETDFPLTPLGKMQQLIWKHRCLQVNSGSMVFLGMYDPYESWESRWPEGFWREIIRGLYDMNVPMQTMSSLVPACFTRSFSVYGYMDIHRNLHDVWYWTTQLLFSRMYLGVECFFSQLAYLLGVPSIIVGADESDLTLPSKGPGQLVRALPSGIHFEKVLDAYNEMGRMLFCGH
jgi:hypothetical protein